MQSLSLLKQRLINHEKEPPEFLANKAEVLGLRDQIVKAASGLKAWLDGAKALEKAAEIMNTALDGSDPSMIKLSTTVSQSLAQARGLSELAYHSMTQKAASLAELKIKCGTLDTLHLEMYFFLSLTGKSTMRSR